MKKLPTSALALPLLAAAPAARAAKAAKNDPAAEGPGRPTPAARRTRAPRRPPHPARRAGTAPARRPPPWRRPSISPSCARSTNRLRDELFRARARAELVEEGIYASKLAATLRWKGAPDFILHRAEIRLDGNAIWDSGEKPLVDELIKVSERPIKPGTHTVTVKMEVRPGKKGEKEHANLGYESEQTFVVEVPETGTTTVALTADDDGDLPEYEPEVDLEVKTEK